MPNHSTIRRYTLIIEKISNNRYPSFEAIKDFLFEHGFEVSARTIQRDIEQIRYEFGMEVIFDRRRNGYYIDPEMSMNSESFLRFLEMANTAELFTESLKEGNESLKYVSFESNGNLKGMENLKSLLFAVKTQRKVSFLHENFESGTIKKYQLNPYLIKEYQNRWYLVGMTGLSGEFRTFGIDRIQNLDVKEDTFIRTTETDPAELFENIIGLTYSDGKPEEVVLSFSPLQGKYIKTLTLHKSQEILIDNDEELLVRLWIIPNFEFKQKILMMGENVLVLKPAWFIEEIKKSLESALNKYKKLHNDTE